MPSLRYVGIDPGASGCIAVITPQEAIEFIDFKTEGLEGYVETLKLYEAHELVIGVEKVSAMPKQGVVSMFNFGMRYGEIMGMLESLGLGFSLVRPLQWQRACSVAKKSGKKGIHTAIHRLYPEAQLKGPKGGLLEGRCDALGIAHYMRITFK